MQGNLFLRWVGGKQRLINALHDMYPGELFDGSIDTYIEPFLGAGAVFFDVVKTGKIEKAYLSDINPDLIMAYEVVKRAPLELLKRCNILLEEYMILPSKEEKGAYYYTVRETYNAHRHVVGYNKWSTAWIDRAAMFIFINRAGYSGLYRVNSKGDLNTPFGWFEIIKMPREEVLLDNSQSLSIAELRCADFIETLDNACDNSFIYCDPPYIPVSKTSDFTGYSEGKFYEQDQVRLANRLQEISKTTNAKIMSSNSYQENGVLRELYGGMYINEVKTIRSVRVQMANKPITEVVITNYDSKKSSRS